MNGWIDHRINVCMCAKLQKKKSKYKIYILKHTYAYMWGKR